MSKWMISAKKADFNRIAQTFHLSPITARLLRNRGLVEESEIAAYLNCEEGGLRDPFLLPDVERAVSILQDKLRAKKKIRIIGDYDVDGICSSYILWKVLNGLQAEVDVVLPHRIRDGYGISTLLVDQAKKDGVDTILTCDNGIAARDQVKHAKEVGMTVIVSDHHDVPKEGSGEDLLPEADAVVNPKRADSSYPFHDICGAVVAFKWMQVLLHQEGREEEAKMDKLYPFAALATVCDVMPLLDENRIIVKRGLRCFANKTAGFGLEALIRVNGLSESKISTYHLGFVLGPCLNATGRLDFAQRGLHLLRANNKEVALQLANELKALNDSRKELTREGVAQAKEVLEEMKKEKKGSLPDILVIYLPHLHESIAGIVAGRIREFSHRPTLVITASEDGVKGSGRSIPSYNMFEVLSAVKDLFTKFGGHPMAAGFSMKEDRIADLRKRLNDASLLTKDDLEEVLHLDMELPPSVLSIPLIREWEALAPYGNGNKQPLFAARKIRLLHGMRLGKQGNVGKYQVTDETERRYDLLCFKEVDCFDDFLKKHFGESALCALYGRRGASSPLCKTKEQEEKVLEIAIAYYPQVNEWGNQQSLQLVMEDYKVIG